VTGQDRARTEPSASAETGDAKFVEEQNPQYENNKGRNKEADTDAEHIPAGMDLVQFGCRNVLLRHLMLTIDGQGKRRVREGDDNVGKFFGEKRYRREHQKREQ
jgi:hypothetical protein